MSKSKADNKKPDVKEAPQQADTRKAYEQAESDIEHDPEMNIEPETGDDLDEGELAQLEGED